ncbi:hypothetical protein [Phycobacter sp. K97]|uniref:hypothetical protein n=1 Tax=Phycobacter sedimenti TaxID=3133977 RepID=UPI00311E3DFE
MSEQISSTDRMSLAVRDWMHELQSYPGWREWKRGHIAYVLSFDDEVAERLTPSKEFMFSQKIENEHAVVLMFLELLSTAHALRDVEWYFRRYPFSQAPVSRESHLRYCCEMYFGRFYQFRERLKKLSKAVNRACPDNGLDFGRFIKTFDKEFDQEIRARHGVHHHEAFDDAAISRIALLELTDQSNSRATSKQHYQSLYRKTAKDWAARTRRRADMLDLFIEAVAETLLKVCSFLPERIDD